MRLFRTVSCVGGEPLARRRGIRRVRLYGPLVELGVAADPTPGVVERVPHPDTRERRDEPAHVEVDHVVGVRHPGLGHVDARVWAQADALRHAVGQHLLQVDARSSPSFDANGVLSGQNPATARSRSWRGGRAGRAAAALRRS
jgi:hypothetical protein